MSLHTQIAQDRESLQLIESVDDSWSTFDDDTWPSFTSSPTTTASRRRRSSRCKERPESAPASSFLASPCNVKGRSFSAEKEERRIASSIMHIPASPAVEMLIHHSSVSRRNKKPAVPVNQTASRGIAQCRSDDTPVISNTVVLDEEPPLLVAGLDQSAAAADEEVSALKGRTKRTAAMDESSSSSNAEEDDFTVSSRINVSDTDLFRSDSPGCIRLTEHGLKAFEMQQQDESVNGPAAVTPQAFTAGRMRHVVHPRRPRPVTHPKASSESPSAHRERRGSYNDGTDLLASNSSRVLAPCPEDCSTTFTPSPSSSPQHPRQKRGGGLLSSLRGRRGAEEGDAASVTPLCDSDKLVSHLSSLTTMPPTLVVSDTPSTMRRRRFFGLVMRGGARCASNDAKGGKNGSGKNRHSGKSTASQKYLEQVSAQEAKERQKMAEERERRRIEQKRRAYLQQQRAKEMGKRADDEEDAMTRPSSSRTAVTAQSSLFDEDSMLLRSSRVSNRSALRSHSSKSRATDDSTRRESTGMFREFGEFLFAETCSGTLPLDDGSLASSTAVTTAPNTHSNNSGDHQRIADASQNALLPPCVVCQSAERTHVATPCFHFLYCAKCAKRMPACVACHQPAKFRPINM